MALGYKLGPIASSAKPLGTPVRSEIGPYQAVGQTREQVQRAKPLSGCDSAALGSMQASGFRAWYGRQPMD
jgi:hypothetical protein